MNRFSNFQEIKSFIESADYKAVGSMCRVGGMGIEAHWKNGGDFAVLNYYVDDIGEHTNVFAVISEEQFDDLSNATKWDNCGAQSGDDARITNAAYAWVKRNSGSIEFYKVGKTYKSGKMVLAKGVNEEFMYLLIGQNDC